MLLTEIIDEHTLRINDPSLSGLLNNDLKRIISLIELEDFTIRIVGGAVRDVLLGKEPRDIDLLTDCHPDDIIYILSEHHIDVDPSGLRHGTIKAILNNIKYEITSKDFTINRTNTGKIHIKPSGSWEEDAKRRDFSINSLSMDLDGKIYDYCNGIKDLKDQFIRPLGDFEAKIIADPVIILRFFKMLSKFDHPKFKKTTLEIVKKHLDLLSQLSEKRFNREIADIHSGINHKKVEALMKNLKLIK